MNKSTGLFLFGMFAANFANAQIGNFKLINLQDTLKGEKLVNMDEPCGCSSALVNLDPAQREIYFSDQETLKKFSKDKEFIDRVKSMTPEKMEWDMVLEKENYVPQNGMPVPRMFFRVTQLGNGTGQWDTGFYRSDWTPLHPQWQPKKLEIPKLPEPLFF